MAQRLRNTLNPVDTKAQTPVGQPQNRGACIASDKKRFRAILGADLHDSIRAARPSGDVGANYRVMSDDELADGEFPGDSGDSHAECDAIAASGLRAISSDYFHMFGYTPKFCMAP